MTSADYLSTGGGKLFIRPILNGAKQPMTYFGATDTVTLSTEVEFLEHKNSEESTQRTDRKVAKSRTATLNFTTGEISPEMLLKAFMGKKSTSTQASATEEAQTITNIAYDTFYDMGMVKITALEVKDSTDATTYVNNIDYAYDKNTGYIEFLKDGAILEAEEVHLAISCDTYEKVNIATLKGTQLQGELIFISNPQAGEKYRYTFKKVDITATGDFALKSEDFSTITFEGEALVDSGVTDPDLSDYFDIEPLPND